ncbi:SHOCT domain-containing protein [Streptomyces sp. NBC_00234]|uniref:SHOCT domain-containing protein n=1 Tax=Streptomyces sp. NBC_00234 TaxID=2903638 RepID=UPI002E2A5E7E|nr:SHOCT domain-containing protein [Streptomyces sp. NBC_00234]
MDAGRTGRTLRITYQGPPMLAGVLAQILREDGQCEVDFEPPQETRDALGAAGLAVATVQFLVQTSGMDDRIKEAINKFLQKFSRAQPQVQIDGEPTASDELATSSIADELAKLASLHADGHLTDQEFSEAKARVLQRGY